MSDSQPSPRRSGTISPNWFRWLFQALWVIPLLALAVLLIRQPGTEADLEPAAFGMHTEGALLNLDFEKPASRPLTASAAISAWSSPDAALTTMSVFPENSIVEGGNERNRFLVRKFAKGTYNSPDKAFRNIAILRWSLAESHKELYLAYRVRTSYGFEQGRGGKLPGLCGGTCPTGGESPTNGSRAAGWSSRIMWNSTGWFNEYLYWADQPGTYGEGIPLTGAKRGPAFNDGGWHVVQQHVRMNDAGRSNGRLQVSIDGTVYLDRNNLRFQDDNAMGIDTLLFSNFFGGNDASWASPADQRIYFDDIVLSPHPIVRER